MIISSYVKNDNFNYLVIDEKPRRGFKTLSGFSKLNMNNSYYPVKNLLGDMNKNTTTKQLFNVLVKQNKLINDYINIEVWIFFLKRINYN